jgi:hypothetical protein
VGSQFLAGGDGIAALEASRNYPGTIDLLLSDVDMPRRAVWNFPRPLLRNAPESRCL